MKVRKKMFHFFVLSSFYYIDSLCFFYFNLSGLYIYIFVIQGKYDSERAWLIKKKTFKLLILFKKDIIKNNKKSPGDSS